MIRDATPYDLPTIVRMGEAFHAESAWASSLAPFDPISFAETCVRIVKNGGHLLVADEGGEVVGMIGATEVPLYFNHAEAVTQEVFWYVRPDRRTGAGMKLVDELVKRSEASRAVLVAGMESLRGGAVGAAFARKGFDPVERMYARITP